MADVSDEVWERRKVAFLEVFELEDGELGEQIATAWSKLTDAERSAVDAGEKWAVAETVTMREADYHRLAKGKGDNELLRLLVQAFAESVKGLARPLDLVVEEDLTILYEPEACGEMAPEVDVGLGRHLAALTGDPILVLGPGWRR